MHISLTETSHCKFQISKNIQFEKNNHFFQYFRKFTRKSKSKGRILEGLLVSLTNFISPSFGK